MARRRVVYRKNRQTHKGDQTKRGRSLDAKRKALPPGKRRSSSGKIHYEYRANRTDLKHDAPKGRRTRTKANSKKWGKVGAPGSAKRKAWMRKIRKKR